MGFWPVVKRVIKDSDIILVVLDARMPELSRNKALEGMMRRHRKKKIYVINKRDLVSEEHIRGLKKDYPGAIFVSGSKNIGMSKLRETVLIAAKRLGLKDPMIGVVGYPNVGKSAIINALAKGARAKVSRLAGTTKGIQWIKAGSLRILDSPGVVPFGDSEVKLGLLGAKNPEKIKNVHKIIFKLIGIFLERNRGALERRYNVDLTGKDEEESLLEIGRKRGFLQKGGIVDERRTTLQIIRDWQSGTLGI